MKFVAQNKADMGYPSPGVLTASIDSGMGVKSVWNVISGQVFNFGLPANSTIKSPKELEGKSISLGSSCLPRASDPMPAMCVPGRIHSALNSGTREGVAVTMMSAWRHASPRRQIDAQPFASIASSPVCAKSSLFTTWVEQTMPPTKFGIGRGRTTRL